MRIRTGTRNAVRFIPALIATLLSLAAIGGEPALAGTIDKIRADQTLRIAYREDAPPFSYKDANSTEPTGYMIQLCRAVAKKLADQLNIPTLKVSYVPPARPAGDPERPRAPTPPPGA